MSHRPLVLVSGLTVGDYLLWNWSLERQSRRARARLRADALPPLAVACCGCSSLGARPLARASPTSVPTRAPPPRTVPSHAAGAAAARRPRAGAAACLRGARRPRRTPPARPRASSPPERPVRAGERPPQAPAPPLQTRAHRARRARGARRARARGARSAATSTSATAPAASTTRTRASSPQPTPTLPARGPSALRLAAVRLQQGTHALLPRARTRAPPFKRLWVHNSHSLLEFPPVIYGERIFQLADDAVLQRDRQAHRARALVAPARAALRLHPGRHRQHRLRHDPLQRAPAQARPHRRAEQRHRRDPLVSLAAQPQRVLAAARPRAPVLRLAERHRVRAQRSQRRRHLDLPRRRRGQGQPHPVRRRPLLRRLLRAPAGDLRAAPGGGCG